MLYASGTGIIFLNQTDLQNKAALSDKQKKGQKEKLWNTEIFKCAISKL